jgi:hypothetical protein
MSTRLPSERVPQRASGAIRRLVFIAGIGAASLLLSSCINFGTPLTGSLGTGPTVDTGVIAAGDVNGDGRRDGLVMKSDGQLWSVQRCTFDQCLAPFGSVTPPAGVRDLAVADFDFNGIDDVVAAGDLGVRVYFGHDPGSLPPQGGLSQADSIVLTSAPRRAVIVADLNRDTLPDVGVISGVGYEFYPSIDAGQFGGPVPVYSIPAGFVGELRELVVADVDGNGWREAVFAGLFFNEGRGTFEYGIGGFEGTAPKLLFTASVDPILLTDPGPIAVCDLDRDGRDDLARATATDIGLLRSVPDAQFGNTLVGFGPGGAFTELESPTPTNTIRARDFDADGKCDVLVGRQGGISWWHGNGDGSFVTVNGISRIDKSIPDLKSLDAGLDAGDNQPDLWVSQGKPDGRVSWVENKSVLP